MDAVATVNLCLAGFFACGAFHFAIQWGSSRHERILLWFAIQFALYTAFCLAMVEFLQARTIPDSQAALDRFVTIGIVTHAGFLQIYALLSGRRDHAFRALVTATLFFLAILNQWAPLRGTVVELRLMHLPGGSTWVVPVRTPPGALLVLLYLAVLLIYIYGLLAARTIWKRDRIGAVLIGIASAAILIGAVFGFLIDFAHVRASYAGAIPHVILVLCVSLFLSREYAARSARVVASERQAERALRETQEVLSSLQVEQRRRQELEVDRQKAMEGLVKAQRMELASHLAASVAHDFNNLLTVISIWSSLMTDGSPSVADQQEARLALDQAQQQARELSQQLLTLARPHVRSVMRMPLDQPIRKTLATLMSAMPGNIQIDFEAPATTEVEANETEIQQMVYNLVLNARDAMPNGGTIQVTTELVASPTPINVVGGSLAAGRWATLTVKDTGAGIAPAVRDRIFDLFFTTKEPERGTGLGLATVLRIASVNGGGVALETEEGQGATFRVYIPACQAVGRPAGAPIA